MFYFLWHVEKIFVLSLMSAALQHTHCIVTCKLVNLLWERCFNPVLMQGIKCQVVIFIWNIWSGIMWYIDLSTPCKLTFLFVLEIGLFEFVSLDAKALQSIASSFGYQLWTGLYKVFYLDLLTHANWHSYLCWKLASLNLLIWMPKPCSPLLLPLATNFKQIFTKHFVWTSGNALTIWLVNTMNSDNKSASWNDKLNLEV